MLETPGVAENGGFISTTVGRIPGRWSAMFSALWRVTRAPGKSWPRSPARTSAISFRWSASAVLAAEGALGHHGQHAGAGRGFEHDIAGADGGGAERGIGERQRGRELLEANLVLGALGMGGLQCGDRGKHGQHAAGTVRPGAGLFAHGAAVTLDEQDDSGLGGLVGVLPDPGAVGIAGAEGAGHGGADRGGVERPAGFEDGKQGPGGGDERVRAGGCAMRGRRGGRHGVGGMRARGCVRRLGGVEHGVLRIGIV